MPFTNIGAAQAFVQAASILPRGDYGTGFAGNGWEVGHWVPGLNAGLGAPTPASSRRGPQQMLQQQRAQVNAIKILAATLTGHATGVLAPVGTDVGVLTTAAAAANQHGLPINFGPGRGNWTLDDVARLWVRHDNEAPAAGDVPAVGLAAGEAAGGNFPYVDIAETLFVAGADPLFGDVQITWKARAAGFTNPAPVALPSVLNIHLLYLPSVAY